MHHVHKSLLIWYSPQQMMDLVTDVAKYPQFLPWCDHSKVLEMRPSPDEGQSAEIGISFGGIKQSFATRNTHVHHKNGALEDKLALQSGPFSKLEGRWLFTPVGDGSNCRVELDLHYDFASPLLAALIGPVFERITTSLVDAFVKRAEQVYG
jgi:ribosome-associated toxin RatA of RatAB toxin-antitoxin module